MDAGFNIVGSSDIINERFNMDINNDDSADILVYDKEDINGITVNGDGSEKVVDVLQKHFFDVSIKKIETGDIYCGKIKRIETKLKNIFVDLGKEEGILSLQNYWGFLREGEKVLVQVKGVVRGVKLLSTQLRLFGNNLILIKDGFTKVSKHVASQQELNRLTGISRNIKIDGWGILWKAQAEGKSDAELTKEINGLIKEEKELKEKFNNLDEPQVLKKGSCTYFVDFGYWSYTLLCFFLFEAGCKKRT